MLSRSATTCSQLVPRGWSFDTTRGVCAHSSIALGGCHGSATLNEAVELCVNFGVRLCTPSELHIAKGTGCGFDATTVWAASESCVNGSLAVHGGQPSQQLCDANATARYAVRCCADVVSGMAPEQPPTPPPPSPSPLPPASAIVQPPPSHPPPVLQRSAKTCELLHEWARDATLGVCASSSAGMGGCAHSESFANASARCAQHGVRLCSQAELHIAKGTGCGEDAVHVWVADSCYNSTDNSTGRLAALGHNPRLAPRCERETDVATRHAVRCCADAAGPPSSPPSMPPPAPPSSPPIPTLPPRPANPPYLAPPLRPPPSSPPSPNPPSPSTPPFVPPFPVQPPPCPLLWHPSPPAPCPPQLVPPPHRLASPPTTAAHHHHQHRHPPPPPPPIQLRDSSPPTWNAPPSAHRRHHPRPPPATFAAHAHTNGLPPPSPSLSSSTSKTRADAPGARPYGSSAVVSGITRDPSLSGGNPTIVTGEEGSNAAWDGISLAVIVAAVSLLVVAVYYMRTRLGAVVQGAVQPTRLREVHRMDSMTDRNARRVHGAPAQPRATEPSWYDELHGRMFRGRSDDLRNVDRAGEDSGLLLSESTSQTACDPLDNQRRARILAALAPTEG